MKCRICVVVVLLAWGAAAARAQQWTRFRGPDGTGVAPALAVPNQWTDDDYAWQIELPGVGHGSPVVYGDLVFVTSGNANGSVNLDAYNVATGKRAWHQTLAGETFRKHTLNAQSSTTPAVDSQHVYVSFYSPGNVHLAAFTHQGKPAWQKDLGEFTCEHGFASSPIVVGDLVCMQGENSRQGYLVALDAATGNQRWRATRAKSKEAYSTPATMTLANGKQLIVNSTTAEGITAIDPADGSKHWQSPKALPERTVGSPLVVGDLVLASCGSGGGGKLMTACRITPTGGEQVFTLDKNIPYVPTGVSDGKLLYLIHDRGTMSCVDLKSHDTLWTKRLGGKFYCSPILLGDRLLCVSMEGEAVMLAAGRDFNVLGRTELAEGTQATPAVADGRLFIRTATRLYCLAE